MAQYFSRRAFLQAGGAAALSLKATPGLALGATRTHTDLDLKIDMSASIMPDDYAIQFLGHSRALRSLAEEIVKEGPIGITSSIFNDKVTPLFDWQLLETPYDVQAYAMMIEASSERFEFLERAVPTPLDIPYQGKTVKRGFAEPVYNAGDLGSFIRALRRKLGRELNIAAGPFESNILDGLG